MRINNPSKIYNYACTVNGKETIIPPGGYVEVEDKPKKSRKIKEED